MIYIRDEKTLLRNIKFLKRDFNEGKISKREFNRYMSRYKSELDDIRSINKVRNMQGKRKLQEEKQLRDVKTQKKRKPSSMHKRSENKNPNRAPKDVNKIPNNRQKIKNKTPVSDKNYRGRKTNREGPVNRNIGGRGTRRRPNPEGVPVTQDKPSKVSGISLALIFFLVVAFIIGISFGTMFLEPNKVEPTPGASGVLKVNETTFPLVIQKTKSTDKGSNTGDSKPSSDSGDGTGTDTPTTPTTPTDPTTDPTPSNPPSTGSDNNP